MPEDKASRVTRFHRNTLRAVADIVGATGVSSPAELKPHHFNMRLNSGETVTGDKAYPELPMGCLVENTCEDEEFARRWVSASADNFARPDLR